MLEISTSISSAPVEVKASSLENTGITGSTEKVGCHTEDQGEKYVGRGHRILIILSAKLHIVLGNLGHSLRGVVSIKQIASGFVLFLLFFFVYSLGSWFLLVERAVIISLMCLLVILCAAQLSVIGKY